jgi:two-component system sensor histidine kinase RegB
MEFFLQLLFDLGLLTVMLYFTGGSTNPFAMLYLVPLAFSAATLPARYTWALVAMGSACYGALFFYSVPVLEDAHDHARALALHVSGMWFGFALSATLIAWFVTRMAGALRERDAHLARLREARLKQERVVALGTLAAGAAHELATPLSTLAVLATDLKAHSPVPIETQRLLGEEIARCKRILQTLSAAAGVPRAEGGGEQSLEVFLQETVRAWRAARPRVVLGREIYDGPLPAPSIVNERTLAQAITNILNNAADASSEHVGFECRWTDRDLWLEVADRGPGVAPEVAQGLGTATASTKESGLGLGLFLSHATFERFGGSVVFQNREGGGTVCRVDLPLAALRLGSRNGT